ncbi:MAG: hypothetical protein HFJ24_04035 [Clostridia bacterium]|nr:hypothetical protein [Clostridia bacterium]MCI9275166.1 hypothetical protein [Clostridia bacterium]
MPRIARNNLGASFFHIMVQGINKSYIFNDANDKNKYISILKEYTVETNVQLIAYCIMDNHAHMLLYTNKINDMSKFMHLVDTKYSNYYNTTNNRVGYVFRDRYKSEPIYEEKYLLNCINYIHMNPVKAGSVKSAEEYRYSSCSQYMHNIGISKSKVLYETLKITDYRETLKNTKNNKYFMDVDIDKTEKIMFLTQEYQKEKGKSLESIINTKKITKDLILFLHDENNVKYIDIARAFEISKTKIFNIKK